MPDRSFRQVRYPLKTQKRTVSNIVLAAALLAALAGFAFPPLAMAQGQVLYEQAADWNSTLRSASKAELADDFVVPAGGAWIIGEVQWHFDGPLTPDLAVSFYADDGGQPGALLYRATDLTDTDPGWEVVYALDRPAVLRPGHYWLAVEVPGPLGSTRYRVGQTTGHPSLARVPGEPWQSFYTPGLDLYFRLTRLGGYPFAGFLGTVDSAALNQVKAGSAVPLKFSLGGDYGLEALQLATSTEIACEGAIPGSAEQATVAAEASGLQYHAVSQQYTYVWKTEKAWAGTCRELTLTLDDGTTHTARFLFK